MEVIEIIKPKPYQRVGAKFEISGWVPTKWLEWNGHVFYRLSLDFIGIDGKTFMGSSIDFTPLFAGLFKNSKRLYFRHIAQLDYFNISFIEKSQGCINIQVSVRNEIDKSVFIPLIVEEFVPEGGISQEIKDKHGKIGDIIRQFNKDLQEYNKGMVEIFASRKAKDNNEDPQYLYGPDSFFASEILKIVEDSDDTFKEYTYSEEDKKEQELNEKYKDALEWRGPVVRGIISQFGGCELRVHSDDHGKHFHVIHRGKGINARFSFPEIRLVNYVNSRNTISSRLEKNIREFCLKPEIFKKFEEEFERRDG